MLRWLVNYIDENQEQWRIDKEIRQGEKGGEIVIQGEEREKTTTPQKSAEIPEKTKWEGWREKARSNYRRKEKRKESDVGRTEPIVGE